MKQKKTVRTGIVGSGFAARFHYEAISKIHGTVVDVVGVHSLDVPTAKRYAEDREIRYSDTLDALVDAVDVVHVCVPPIAHETVAVAALKRDKFAICEKWGIKHRHANDVGRRADQDIVVDCTGLDEGLALAMQGDSIDRLGSPLWRSIRNFFCHVIRKSSIEKLSCFRYGHFSNPARKEILPDRVKLSRNGRSFELLIGRDARID